MLKPTFKNIMLYILVSCITFFIFMMIKNQDFKLLEIKNLISRASIIDFFIFMMPLPIANIFLFAIPVNELFKSKKLYICFFIIFIIQYFAYVFLTSQKYFWDINGICFEIINIVIFSLFFYKHLSSIEIQIRVITFLLQSRSIPIQITH
jgi:hypothetical protein